MILYLREQNLGSSLLSPQSSSPSQKRSSATHAPFKHRNSEGRHWGWAGGWEVLPAASRTAAAAASMARSDSITPATYTYIGFTEPIKPKSVRCVARTSASGNCKRFYTVVVVDVWKGTGFVSKTLVLGREVECKGVLWSAYKLRLMLVKVSCWNGRIYG